MSKNTEIQAIIVLLFFILSAALGYGFYVFIIYLVNLIFGTTLNIWLGGLLLMLLITLITPIFKIDITKNLK
jgi:hypothetical protein